MVNRMFWLQVFFKTQYQPGAFVNTCTASTLQQITRTPYCVAMSHTAGCVAATLVPTVWLSHGLSWVKHSFLYHMFMKFLKNSKYYCKWRLQHDLYEEKRNAEIHYYSTKEPRKNSSLGHRNVELKCTVHFPVLT